MANFFSDSIKRNPLDIKDESNPPAYLDFLQNELQTLRIIPIAEEIFNSERYNIKQRFFEDNDDLILNTIRINKRFVSTVDELVKVFDPNEQVILFMKLILEYFTKSILDKFLSMEINYLYNFKNTQNLQFKIIMGDLISFNITENTYKINTDSLNQLSDQIGIIVNSFATLLRQNNSEWLQEFMKNNRKYLGDKAYLEKQLLKELTGNPDDIFIKNIKKAKQKLLQSNKTISKSAVARELGLSSSTFSDKLKKVCKNKKIEFMDI